MKLESSVRKFMDAITSWLIVMKYLVSQMTTEIFVTTLPFSIPRLPHVSRDLLILPDGGYDAQSLVLYLCFFVLFCTGVGLLVFSFFVIALSLYLDLSI